MGNSRSRTSAIGSWSHAELRERVLAGGARALSRTRRTLWYAETLVLSARYQQWLAGQDWAQEAQNFTKRADLWTKALLPRLSANGFAAMEFGVANGDATRWWANHSRRIVEWHAFDTFSGLPADWARGGVSVMTAGVFVPDGGPGAMPDVPDWLPVAWHVGLIEDTLADLAERPCDTQLLILIDVDLLEPTRTILSWVACNGRSGDLIYFDEAFDPWNEGMALKEAVAAGLQVRGLGYTGSALAVEVT